jgi:hypothetical protein
VIDHTRTDAGQTRWRGDEQPDLLVIDAVKDVLQGHQRRVVDQVGVVDSQEHRTEATHRDQERVEGRAELAKVALAVAC